MAVLRILSRSSADAAVVTATALLSGSRKFHGIVIRQGGPPNTIRESDGKISICKEDITFAKRPNSPNRLVLSK